MAAKESQYRQDVASDSEDEDGPVFYDGAERRANLRLKVESRVQLQLTGSGITMPGRVVDLSLSGCKLRTDERYVAGIFVRVEIEFNLRGIPFRLAGVSQVIFDPHTIGVRFLDVSERRRSQLIELIREMAG
jgi:hypothetical protein